MTDSAGNRWHSLTPMECIERLGSHPVLGLEDAEVKKRQHQYGVNRLREASSVGPLKLFLHQFRDHLVWILVIAALVAGWLDETVDAVVILLLVTVNALVGFVQELRAEHSMSDFRSLSR